jgi:hypothetical protein
VSDLTRRVGILNAKRVLLGPLSLPTTGGGVSPPAWRVVEEEMINSRDVGTCRSLCLEGWPSVEVQSARVRPGIRGRSIITGCGELQPLRDSAEATTRNQAVIARATGLPPEKHQLVRLGGCRYYIYSVLHLDSIFLITCALPGSPGDGSGIGTLLKHTLSQFPLLVADFDGY